MKLTRLASALAVTALMASGASAATLSFSGMNSHSITIGTNHDSPLLTPGTVIGYVRGDAKTATDGLMLDESVRLKFTYIFSEASNTNFLSTIGGKGFSTDTATIGDSFTVKLNGLLDFAVGTTQPVDRVSSIVNNGLADPGSQSPTRFGIAFLSFGGDPAWYVALDDIAQGDRDFDDLIFKVELAKIPVPAAGFLLLGGVGALGALSRRRKKD
jgi:hypothetical protein